MDESNKTLNDIESFKEISEQTAEELASAFESFSKSMEDNEEIYERILGNLKQEVRLRLSGKFVELAIHFANATFLTRWYWRRKIKKFIQGLDEITKNIGL